MNEELRARIYKYLLDNPDCGRNDAARHFNVTASTLQAHMTKHYGLSFQARQDEIQARRIAEFRKYWPEIKKALDTESCSMLVIAKRYGFGRETMRKMVVELGYDMRERVSRMQQDSNRDNPRKGLKVVVETYRRESMAGYMSLRAHTMPMNQWGELAA